MNSIFPFPNFFQKYGGTPAPAECFKQAAVPPVNKYKLGMRLEAKDPRNIDSYCVATVVGVIGARVRLRLDGSDNKNDFWRMIDSKELQPMGTCQQLQPPLGYRNSASGWHNFLSKIFSEKDTFAPADCFVPEPEGPKKNMFEVGHKLEAVDKKNPQLICCATVNRVKDDQIYVKFDGWRGAFDYWCRYDCRDIFPAGYSSKSCHPMQPPGRRTPHTNRQKSVKQNSSDAPIHPVTIFLHHTCKVGPLFYVQKLPQKLTSPSHEDLTKLLIEELLGACKDTRQLSPVLYGLEGDVHIITAANQNFTAKIPNFSDAKNPDEHFKTFIEKLLNECHICKNFITFEMTPNTHCDKCPSSAKRVSNRVDSPSSTVYSPSTSTPTGSSKRRQVYEFNESTEADVNVPVGSAKSPSTPDPKISTTTTSVENATPRTQTPVLQQQSNITPPPRKVAKLDETPVQSQPQPSKSIPQSTPKPEIATIPEEVTPITSSTPVSSSSGVDFDRQLNINVNVDHHQTHHVNHSLEERQQNSFYRSEVRNPPVSPVIPQGNMENWSIPDVIQYISNSDSSLAVHAELFRRHVSGFLINS